MLAIKYNSNKRKDFFITSSIVVASVIIVVLALNYFLVSIFGFDQMSFYPITIVLVLTGIVLHYSLSSSIIDPLLKSDEHMQKVVKETLHELNTPVSTIMMNIAMMKKQCTEGKNSKRIERIEQSCKDLLALYDQMEYSIKRQIESIEIDEFDLAILIEEELQRFEDIKENITIKNTIHTPIQLKTDRSGLKKVIDNLLSNAIKHNEPDGFVNIEYKDYWLSISNTGKKIDTKNLFMIFEEHYQENTTSKGFGLGLSIVKEFCDTHKIEIKINSDELTTIKLNLKNILS